VFKQKPWRSMAAAKHNKDRSGSESDARVARALKRDKVRRSKLHSAAGPGWPIAVVAPALNTATTTYQQCARQSEVLLSCCREHCAQVRQKAIAAAGIDYSYDSLADAMPKKAKRTVFAET
jgi:hypothetical protein